MKEIGYNRIKAAQYARLWAFGRNPAYYDFERLGGDCTNFVSQCLFAGCGVMNFAPVFGWYYRSASDRTASWTGVEFLYNFLVANEGAGPYAKEAPLGEMRAGDVIQLAETAGIFTTRCSSSGFREACRSRRRIPSTRTPVPLQAIRSNRCAHCTSSARGRTESDGRQTAPSAVAAPAPIARQRRRTIAPAPEAAAQSRPGVNRSIFRTGRRGSAPSARSCACRPERRSTSGTNR